MHKPFAEHSDQLAQYYHSLFENSPLPVLLFDMDTLEFIEVNKAAVAFYGYSEKKFASMKFTDIYSSSDAALVNDYLSKTRDNDRLLTQHVWKHIKKNGDVAHVNIRCSNLSLGGRHIRLMAINDITNTIKAEAKLKRINEQYRQANERYNIIANATHDLVWDWNLETNEIYRDPKGLLEVYGVRDNESIKHINQWLERIHPDDLPNVQNTILSIVNAGEQNIFDVEYRFRGENGEYSYIFDRGYILRNKEGRAYRMIGAAQNITVRKKLEHELLDQQKAISQATITTQEKERMEISKELHDNVNQVLTTTKLYLDLAMANPDLKDELISKSSNNIINAISEIRKLSQSLMIPSLGDLGLIDSIDDLIENINTTKKIDAIFVHDELDENSLNENQKLTLFRITQEALNNVVKHAEATHTTIRLLHEEKTIRLIIEDNGKGFDSATAKKGAGLNNIRNRVYLLNGNLAVDAHPGQGCTLVVELPIRL